MSEKDSSKIKQGAKNTAGSAFEKGAELGGAVAGTAGGAGIGAVGGAILGSVLPGAGTLAGAKLGAKKGADAGANIGKETGKALGKAGNFAIRNSNAITNPIDFILDGIIKFFVDLIIPIPIVGEYAGDVVAKQKWKILGIFVAIVWGIVMLLNNTASASSANNYEGLPESLRDYIEKDFTDSPVPQHSPFGGKGTEYTVITAYYHDPDYYAYYGRWHDALDIVPNGKYYNTNEAYKKYKDVVMFATCSGKATGRIDSYGANYVVTECKDGVHITWHLHNKVNFIPLNQTVDIVAGQPIAVMGETGRADGAHIHYVILKNGKYVDPLPYLNN